MNQTFFIADTHFGHKNIIRYENAARPFTEIEEHDEELIRRWNLAVRQKDFVWVLGDFCFGKDKLAIAGRLNGTKRLVMGNHDMYPAADYLQYFSKVYGAVEYKEAILTHIPVHPDQLKRYRFNIHGHLHQNVIGDDRYWNVSAEQINLTPISYEDLCQKYLNKLKGI